MNGRSGEAQAREARQGQGLAIVGAVTGVAALVLSAAAILVSIYTWREDRTPDLVVEVEPTLFGDPARVTGWAVTVRNRSGFPVRIMDAGVVDSREFPIALGRVELAPSYDDLTTEEAERFGESLGPTPPETAVDLLGEVPAHGIAHGYFPRDKCDFPHDFVRAYATEASSNKSYWSEKLPYETTEADRIGEKRANEEMDSGRPVIITPTYRTPTFC